MKADAPGSYEQLMAELKRLCAEGRTGTLFIATSDNPPASSACAMASSRRRSASEPPPRSRLGRACCLDARPDRSFHPPGCAERARPPVLS
jgi:hypothetical protein